MPRRIRGTVDQFGPCILMLPGRCKSNREDFTFYYELSSDYQLTLSFDYSTKKDGELTSFNLHNRSRLFAQATGHFLMPSRD